jgi:alkylation response protein AidB-like acyl-CoA dehydrogenase
MKYFPPVCAGETVCAGAYTEPNAGTDVAGYKTRAVQDGDDYVITGNKMFITNGTVCDWMVVQAITDPDQKVHKSFSQFIVPADAPGITRTKIRGKLGIRASDTAEIALDGVRVPRENLIGKRGAGFHQLMHFFDITRVMVAAQGLGLSQACLDESVKYCKERTVFGKPLGSFQITLQKLAEMWIKIEALRNITYKAAWLLDSGKPDYHLSAMAKYLAGQTAVFCANLAVELHGGYGYIEEYKVQKFYRDAKILELYEGTKEAEIMTLGKVLLSH